MMDYRRLLLQLIASLTLADHMGDVSDEVNTVLERLGLDWSWDELPDLQRHLADAGVTTLHGTTLKVD